MVLSDELITLFAKTTNDDNSSKSETTVYGTIVEYEGDKYVKLDGSELLTPISTTVDANPGERVTVLIKNHTATVTGNISSPAARTDDLREIGTQISEFEIIIAGKVDTVELNAVSARIDTLVSDNVTIKGTLDANKADIETLLADNATINEKLTVNTADIETLVADNATIKDTLNANKADINNLVADNATIKDTLNANKADIDALLADNVTINEKLTANAADINSLQASKLDVSEANILYASIAQLDAVKADIDVLDADYADFKTATVDDILATNAAIDNLEANKLSASDIEGKYANIDFSNINKATMETFYANSGLIQNVTIGDATISGRLVGVTISGDLIEAETLVAEKLVIKGEDGLYYKLNTDGETIEADQTEYNSLNGAVITAKSITAEKISVTDLVAFDATIGGFNITEGSLYSGVKESVDNTTSGVYLDKDGQVAFGDASNFIKYYKDTDGNFKLVISADSISFGTSKQNLETAMSDIQDSVNGAKEAIEGVKDYETRITNAEARIEQNSEDILLRVTKTEVEEAIDDIEIGGRNLFENSGKLSNGSIGLYFAPETPEYLISYEEDSTSPSGNCAVFTLNEITTDITNGGPYINGEFGNFVSKMIEGETYTVSVWVKSNTSKTIGVISVEFLTGISSIKPNLSTEWQKYIVTGTYNGNTTSGIAIAFYYGSRWSSGDVLYISSPKIEKGNKATDWTPAPEDVDENINNRIDEVNVTISEQNTQILETCNEIILSALESYVETSNYEEFKETVSTQLAIMANEITMNFTTTTEQINNVDGDVQTKFEQLYKHISFSDNGIEISAGENMMSLTLDNDKIMFMKNGEQFGWWDGVDFHTGNIVVDVNERAQFGNFAFVPRSDGSLMFLKVGE